MAKHPDIQKKAQAQLDTLLGRSRLPELSDIEALPYIQALVLESLRWMPVAPLGFPHTSSGDDVYNGYYIPKGTIVVPVSFAQPPSKSQTANSIMIPPLEYMVYTPLFRTGAPLSHD